MSYICSKPTRASRNAEGLGTELEKRMKPGKSKPRKLPPAKELAGAIASDLTKVCIHLRDTGHQSLVTGAVLYGLHTFLQMAKDYEEKLKSAPPKKPNKGAPDLLEVPDFVDKSKLPLNFHGSMEEIQAMFESCRRDDWPPSPVDSATIPLWLPLEPPPVFKRHGAPPPPLTAPLPPEPPPALTLLAPPPARDGFPSSASSPYLAEEGRDARNWGGSWERGRSPRR